MNAPRPVLDLLERSHRLGADPRTTNYGGGNTSAKGVVVDRAGGGQVELVWVKGSGGDLRTLSSDGLAVLRRDRVDALKRVYRGPEHEDEMVAAFDYCLYGKSAAAPSIDTAMHALVDAAHVDHLHPDAGLAIATAADGERLTREIYGDRVLWVPWRRPGFQLGLDIAAAQAAHPQAVGAILGGHGTTAWGETSEECEARSLWIIRSAEHYLEQHGRPEPLGQILASRAPLTAAQRRRRAVALFPLLRRLASIDEPVVGRFDDRAAVLDFLARSRARELAARGSCCPDHYLRTKIVPLFVDLDADATLSNLESAVAVEHARYRREYREYYERNAQPESPPMRGADPRIVLVPGVGMFSFGKDALTARVAGEYFVNTIAAMRGAESVSEYRPVAEHEKFRIEYWALEEAKLARAPKPRSLAASVVLIADAGAPAAPAIATALVAEGAAVALAGWSESADALAASLGHDRAVRVNGDSLDAVAEAVLAFGGIDVLISPATKRPAFEDAVRPVFDAQDRPGTLVTLSTGQTGIAARHDGRRRRIEIALDGVDPTTVAGVVFAVLGGELRTMNGLTIATDQHRGS